MKTFARAITRRHAGPASALSVSDMLYGGTERWGDSTGERAGEKAWQLALVEILERLQGAWERE